MTKTKSALLGFVSLILFVSGLPAGSIAERAERLHRSSLLVDGHNDLPWRMREEQDLTLSQHDLSKPNPKFNTDIPRLRKGGVGAQFWSVYVPASLMDQGTAAKVTREQIQFVHTMIKRYPDTFELALNAKDITRIHASGKIASLIGMEGGHSIENSLETLRDMHARGARYMTLSHSKNLSWIEASTDSPMPAAITAFGKEVVREMNRLGMLVDISHISARAMREVLAVATAPVIASHSSAYGLKPHVRNVPDDVLKLVAQNGGVVMVNFYPAFIGKEGNFKTFTSLGSQIHIHDCVEEDVSHWRKTNRVPTADVNTVVDHIEHIAKVAGIDHVGLGSDFDGVPTLPVGLEDVSKYPAITEELVRRGHSDEDIKKILGLNVLRAFDAASNASAPLSSLRGRAAAVATHVH